MLIAENQGHLCPLVLLLYIESSELYSFLLFCVTERLDHPWCTAESFTIAPCVALPFKDLLLYRGFYNISGIIYCARIWRLSKSSAFFTYQSIGCIGPQLKGAYLCSCYQRQLRLSSCTEESHCQMTFLEGMLLCVTCHRSIFFKYQELVGFNTGCKSITKATENNLTAIRSSSIASPALPGYMGQEASFFRTQKSTQLYQTFLKHQQVLKLKKNRRLQYSHSVWHCTHKISSVFLGLNDSLDHKTRR